MVFACPWHLVEYLNILYNILLNSIITGRYNSYSTICIFIHAIQVLVRVSPEYILLMPLQWSIESSDHTYLLAKMEEKDLDVCSTVGQRMYLWMWCLVSWKPSCLIIVTMYVLE